MSTRADPADGRVCRGSAQHAHQTDGDGVEALRGGDFGGRDGGGGGHVVVGDGKEERRAGDEGDAGEGDEAAELLAQGEGFVEGGDL